MCVIMIKDKKYKNNDKIQEYLRNMVDGNPDGNGIIVMDDKKIWWKKGITPNELYRLAEQNIDKTILVHTRIGTSGEMTEPFTHPFLVSRKRDHKNILNGILHPGEFLLMHNGTFNINIMDGESDTSTVAKFLRDNAKFWSKHFKKLAQFFDIFGNNSRVVFVNSDGEMGLVGNWVTEDEGLIFSNSNYKWSMRRYRVSYSYPYVYNKYVGYGGYEEPDEDLEEDILGQYYLDDVLDKLNIVWKIEEINLTYPDFSFRKIENNMVKTVLKQLGDGRNVQNSLFAKASSEQPKH